MKKYLIAITLLLTLATTAQAAAQKHRHSATAAVVAQPDTVVVFSDTTGVAEDDTATYSQNYQVSMSPVMDRVISEVEWNDVAGAIFVICVLIVLFILSPVLVIAAIFYFINKNRKEKMKMMQMAIQSGQPIPEQMFNEVRPNHQNNLRRGITQMFTGVGLFIFLGLIFGKLGFGIGALVFFIGLGKLVIAVIDRNNHQGPNVPPPYQHE